MPSALRPAARGRALLAAMACMAVLAASGSARSAEPLRLTIAFTGDVSGYLEPCG